MGSLFLYGKKKESHYICVVVVGCSFSFSERVVRVLFFFYFLSLSFGGGEVKRRAQVIYLEYNGTRYIIELFLSSRWWCFIASSSFEVAFVLLPNGKRTKQ